MRQRIRSRDVLAFAVALALAVAWTGPAQAAPRDATDSHDIGRLLAKADEWFDLEQQDAVVLLDSLHVERLATGEVRSTSHIVVWFGTEIGLETYADVHVPWNSASGSVEVHDLRTWRGDRWWPAPDSVSGTAVVETTPASVYSAYDYAALREQALLHDGVELPCVVETRYTVAQARPPHLGIDGTRVAATIDPTVRTAFVLTLPDGERAVTRALNDAPTPEVSENGSTISWSVVHVPRLGRPLVEDPAASGAALEWSTWGSWEKLARAFLGPFEGAAELTGAPVDSLTERLEGIRGAEARARTVASYLGEATRYAGADDASWRFEPRPAGRTWETAYGHAMDRAVLAAALLGNAGLEAAPAWVGHRGADLTGALPGLARFERLVIDVRGDGFRGAIDPAAAELRTGSSAFAGRSTWNPGESITPRHHAAQSGVLDLQIELAPDGAGGLSGRGYVLGEGWLAPFERVSGLDGAFPDYCAGAVDAVIEGATADNCALTSLSEERVEAAFDVRLNGPEPDADGRIAIIVGSPMDGLTAGYEPPLELCVPTRQTPAALPAPALQRTTIRLDAGEREVVRVPDPVTLSNAAGRFSLSVERDGTWITVERVLEVTAGVRADDWPDLRQLLLEETASRNRTILLR
jgi:hypothetical protein